MNRTTARTVLTILMYGGVLIFLLPYIIERAKLAPFLMLLGAGMAVACGLMRCYLMDENE